MNRGKQYRLSARCPDCNAPVRLRNAVKGVELLTIAMQHPERFGPEAVLQTYQCAAKVAGGGLCNAITEIKMKHWYESES